MSIIPMGRIEKGFKVRGQSSRSSGHTADWHISTVWPPISLVLF